jgi:isopenicillin-N epimerase
VGVGSQPHTVHREGDSPHELSVPLQDQPLPHQWTAPCRESAGRELGETDPEAPQRIGSEEPQRGKTIRVGPICLPPPHPLPTLLIVPGFLQLPGVEALHFIRGRYGGKLQLHPPTDCGLPGPPPLEQTIGSIRVPDPILLGSSEEGRMEPLPDPGRRPSGSFVGSPGLVLITEDESGAGNLDGLDHANRHASLFASLKPLQEEKKGVLTVEPPASLIRNPGAQSDQGNLPRRQCVESHHPLHLRRESHLHHPPPGLDVGVGARAGMEPCNPFLPGIPHQQSVRPHDRHVLGEPEPGTLSCLVSQAAGEFAILTEDEDGPSPCVQDRHRPVAQGHGPVHTLESLLLRTGDRAQAQNGILAHPDRGRWLQGLLGVDRDPGAGRISLRAHNLPVLGNLATPGEDRQSANSQKTSNAKGDIRPEPGRVEEGMHRRPRRWNRRVHPAGFAGAMAEAHLGPIATPPASFRSPAMPDRRSFLASLAGASLAGASTLLSPGRAMARPPLSFLEPSRLGDALEAFSGDPRSPAEVATDETLWREVQQAFTVDRGMVNLNNGGVSPAPAAVQEAMGRYLAYSNDAPVHTMWRVLEPQKEGVRQQLARAFGCDAEEMAITRNASEGLQICQFGIDLEAGDEVLTTDQDYPRMLTTFEQRARREGIVLKKFPIPVPAEDPDEIVRRFEEGITDRTRLILMCHMINITGQILPVKPVVEMARARGIPVIVDGAHAFAHFDFDLADLDCDYYATSLHKWLFAPFGTGFLYVRRNRIPGLWPLMASPEHMDGDIRKFEEVGTHPCANYLAIGSALTFHHGIGPARKEARLVYLRNYWAQALLEEDRVSLNTSLEPGFAAGIANLAVEGLEPGELANFLWDRHRIIVTPIGHPDCRGLRISPSVYTTTQELDRFIDGVRYAIRNGVA